MNRPVTLFTGQFADIPLKELAEQAASWGYDGLELACWGDHVDVDKAAEDKDYAQSRHDILAEHGLKCYAISNHLAGQLVCDLNNDARSDMFAPDECNGDADAKREWAVGAMKNTARAAKNMGLDVVNGFTGSSIWPDFYFFPPTSTEHVDAGWADFADRWNPILDVFRDCGVRFALEVHPGEIAYDTVTAARAVEVLDGRPEFTFNFDPSHLVWQGVDPVRFIDRFADRIAHVHVKDVIRTLDGDTGILGSHLPFGAHGRGWDFRSPGRGEVDFEEIVRALNRIGYAGPLSVEWEDANMDREHGAREAAEFLEGLDFAASGTAFDAAFERA